MTTNTTVSQSPMNVAGDDIILGAQYVKDQDAFIEKMKVQYANTPVFDPNIIPRGANVHIGDGVWMRRCRECDDFALTYGTPYINEFASHEASHELDVPGYNIPLLP